MSEVESSVSEALQTDSTEQSSTVRNNTLGGALGSDTISAGLKEALEVGAKRAITLLGSENGYFDNPLARIPMPSAMQKAGKTLRKLGLNEQVDDFELSLNRAAEQAAPQAQALIVESLKTMSLDDALKILNGPDNAATEYFRLQTESKIAARFKPQIKDSLANVNATNYYNTLASEAQKLPLVGDLVNDANLEDHVTQSALDGLFKMLAAEEKQIRQDPISRSTQLLRQVFTP